MQTVEISSTRELRAFFAGLDADWLFRGQLHHYENAGASNIVSSFSRLGCSPPEMLKWHHYSSNILRGMLGSAASDLALCQALLQHYGWRSFYIDVSTDPAVAAWFGAYQYHEETIIDSCEDCNEMPVWLRRKFASYEEAEEGSGHLYAISRSRLPEGVEAIDLAQIGTWGTRSRYSVQSAWLIGPLSRAPLPPETIGYHLIADRDILREYATQEGFQTTESMFPPPEEDAALATLLRLPWKIIPTDGPEFIPAFRRTIEFPEYHRSYRRILSPSLALYKGTSVATLPRAPEGPDDIHVVAIPELAMFGHPPQASLDRFPHIQRLLPRHAVVVFEIDNLILRGELEGQALYCKGMSLAVHDQGLIEVSEQWVEHPGMTLTCGGACRGWFYEISEDGIWARHHHQDECLCGNEEIHIELFQRLHGIEEYLANPQDFPDL